MSRITELGEASGVSGNDYVLLSSPTAGERKILASAFQGSSGSSAIYCTQAQYDALSTAEKENGSIYFVESEESDWIFSHTSTDSTYSYSEVPSVSSYLAVATSFNNYMYSAMYYNIVSKSTRFMTDSELSVLASKLNMTPAWASSQTVSGNGTTNPYCTWSMGSNSDVYRLNASDLSNVGTKADFRNCKSHLFYKTPLVRRIYFMNKLWTETIL